MNTASIGVASTITYDNINITTTQYSHHVTPKYLFHRLWQQSLGAIPTIAKLQEKAENMRLEELMKASKKLSNLSPKDLEAVDRLSKVSGAGCRGVGVSENTSMCLSFHLDGPKNHYHPCLFVSPFISNPVPTLISPLLSLRVSSLSCSMAP